MGMLGRSGLYLKRPSVTLDLSNIDTIALDKTGTLTSASHSERALPEGLTDFEWQLVRRLASDSTHPTSRAIAATAPAAGTLTDFVEYPGRGIRGTVDGHVVALGSPAFVAIQTGNPVTFGDRRTAVAIDGRSAGRVTVVAAPRPGLEKAVRTIGASHRLCLLSGDHDAEASQWRSIFGDRMWFRQSSEDKLALIESEQAAGRRVLMVGDGLNDAGALAAADVGVAVSDDTACVVPACDAVLRGDCLPQLPAFLAYARRSRQVILICFLVSVGYNAIGLTLALAGALTPLATAILMPVSSLTIVGLSTGAMRWHARRLVRS
jgi:Cu+-exporting ATPase